MFFELLGHIRSFKLEMGQQAQSTTNKGTKLYYLAIHIPKLTHGTLCKSGNRKQGSGYMKNKQHAYDAR
jgi:hypothetical protein